MRTIWQFWGDTAQKPPAALVAAAEDSHLVAKLMMNRGMNTPEAIRHFLDLESYQPTTGLELPDMDKALERIQRAIDSQEHILIYGDFDVDGITGTAILYETLTFLGADVSYYIPDRAQEGHGLNTAACIRLASSRKVKLVVTTDTGITNFAEVSLMNGLGIDTVVTDHHELPENLPPSVANVNPKLLTDQTHPLAPLCGAGVAYKLCELLLEAHGDEAAETLRINLLDLTAVGTVADLALLTDDNRFLVYEGLKVLNSRSRLGVRAILEQAGGNPEATLTSESIAFSIAPRLNAIGRLDNAKQAVELLTSKDNAEATRIAAFLEQLNRKRRELCDETFLEAERQLNSHGGIGDRRAIVLGNPRWNLGVIGIVASRLIEKYHVPVFMMLLDEENQVARCSARSIPGFHLHDELLPLVNLFDGFGGHAGAGGFKLPMKNLNLFKERIYQITSQKITDEQMLPVIKVDDELDWSQINPHLVSLVNKMAPFGMANPSPRFVVNNAKLMSQRGLGENERHLKLVISESIEKGSGKKTAGSIEALYWNYGNRDKLDPASIYRFVVAPEINSFNNTEKVQLIIEDIKKAGDENSSARIAVAQPSQATTGEDAAEGQNNSGDSENLISSGKPFSTPPTFLKGMIQTAEEIIAQAEQAPPENDQDHNGQPNNGAVALASEKTLRVISGLGKAPEAGKPFGSAQIKQGTQWVDHRGREALEAFVGQLMLPLQDKRSVLIYHEGRKPNIPYLNETLLVNRHQSARADELIFWDFPPDIETMRDVLRLTQPDMIHWVGGKFQSVPITQPDKNYLSLLMQVLKQSTNQPVEPKLLAARLGLSLRVVEAGLVLLNRLGMIHCEMLPGFVVTGEKADGGIFALTITLPPSPDQNAPTLESLLEYALFQRELRQMAAFRNHLLSARLERLQSEFLVY